MVLYANSIHIKADRNKKETAVMEHGGFNRKS